MATRGSQEPLKNMDLYNRLKNTVEQLHSANAQITTLQQHNQKLTKDNETLQQKNVELTKKIKDYEEQVKKQSETIKVMTEEKKKTIEEYNKLQQQYEIEKKAHNEYLKSYWQAKYAELIDGRRLKTILNIIHEDEFKRNEWLNSNKIIELIDKINSTIYNDNEPSWCVAEEKFTKEDWQKLEEAKKELMNERSKQR
jgi:regulator of replication initiation timing